jgi:hypothetical protein
MLAAMGFKYASILNRYLCFKLARKLTFYIMERRPGTGLGKNQQGVTQPISVEIRDDKSGLGAFEEKKAAIETDAAMQKLHSVVLAHKRAKLEEQFQNQSKSVFHEKKVIGNIHTALKAIAHLEENDRQKGAVIEESNVKVPEILSTLAALPLRETPVSVHTFLTEELSAAQRGQILLDLLEYLRERYFYCIYCGATYASAEEIESECPGTLYEDHS